MSIARKSAIDAVSQVGIVLLSMIAGIFVSRRLGTDGRGAYILATVLANGVLVNFASFGMRLSLQVFAAREKDKIAELHTFAILFSLIGGGAVAAILLLFAELVQRVLFRGIPMQYLWVVSLTAPFTLYYISWTGMMNGMGEIRRRATIDFVYGATQSLVIIAILLFMRSEPIGLLVHLYYGIMSAASIAMLLLFPGDKSWRLPDRRLIREILGYGKWVYIGNFAAQLRTQMDQLLANYAGSAALLGVYNQAASLASRAQLPAGALQTSAYQPITAGTHEEAGRLVCATFRQMLIIGAALSVVGWICAPLIPIIYGDDFAGAIMPFRILLIAICLLGAARMTTIYFSGHLADPRLPMIVNWVTVGIQFILTFKLIDLCGVLYGVTWATAITLLLTSLIFIVAFCVRRETPPAIELIRFRKDDFARWWNLLPGRKSK